MTKYIVISDKAYARTPFLSNKREAVVAATELALKNPETPFSVSEVIEVIRKPFLGERRAKVTKRQMYLNMPIGTVTEFKIKKDAQKFRNSAYTISGWEKGYKMLLSQRLDSMFIVTKVAYTKPPEKPDPVRPKVVWYWYVDPNNQTVVPIYHSPNRYSYIGCSVLEHTRIGTHCVTHKKIGYGYLGFLYCGKKIFDNALIDSRKKPIVEWINETPDE